MYYLYANSISIKKNWCQFSAYLLFVPLMLYISLSTIIIIIETNINLYQTTDIFHIIIYFLSILNRRTKKRERKIDVQSKIINIIKYYPERMNSFYHQEGKKKTFSMAKLSSRSCFFIQLNIQKKNDTNIIDVEMKKFYLRWFFLFFEKVQGYTWESTQERRRINLINRH